MAMDSAMSGFMAEDSFSAWQVVTSSSWSG